MQVDPFRPTLKALGAKRLKQKYDELLSRFAFNFNLRRYNEMSHMLNDGTERYLEARLVNRILSANLEFLKQVFHHYAAISEHGGGGGGGRTINPRELVTLVRDCKAGADTRPLLSAT